ncbi:hypothetical protein MN116_006626 [Schistosoma mekongi]|uniref:Uncharacterized protein n=1 Tax=Schistosoma mekongi TaxID=38744 RepID=A0AAE1ZAH5_SCHME|nr:hypothetical protein MN116_006626 [Schistosoma mekongi]
MRSISMNEITNNRPLVQSDRITRYASPNRFDIREVPNSFLDSYRSYRSSHSYGASFSKSKFRSTMPTSFSSYAVPWLSEVTSSTSNSNALDTNDVRNPGEHFSSDNRFSDKFVSSPYPKEVSTTTSPINHNTYDHCNSITRHSPNQLITQNNNNNNNNNNKSNNDNDNANINSNSHVQISQHHTSINSSSICCSISPFSSSPPPLPLTIYTNEQCSIHQNFHPNQLYSPYYQVPSNHTMPTSLSYSEISKLNLSSNQYLITPEPTINNNNNNANNLVSHGNNTNSDRLESLTPKNCIHVQKILDKNDSHVNYNSSKKRSIIHSGEDSIKNIQQNDINKKDNNTNNIYVNNNNNQKDNISININLHENNCSTLKQKQMNYPFKTNSFRSVKNKHKVSNKNSSRHDHHHHQQQHHHQRQHYQLNYENELMNFKPDIKLIDSRPRTRLYIESGTKTHTKTMTLQKNLIADENFDSQDLNITGFISLPYQKSSLRKRATNIPTSPSMPLPSVMPTGHWVYNVNLSEMDYYSEPYNSSTCTSLTEYKHTDKQLVDSQNDPELADKLDKIACEIGLLHHQRSRQNSRSSHNIDSLLSAIGPCSESNIPKADLDQLLTLEISTVVSNPAYATSLINDTTALQTDSISSTNPHINDVRHRIHLSRVDLSSTTDANTIEPHVRPRSTGSQIIKEFLRHISPKLRRSLSRLSSRKKTENRKSLQNYVETKSENPQPTSLSFERCKSERFYTRSLLRFIPRCSCRSKECKRREIQINKGVHVTGSYSLDNDDTTLKTDKRQTNEQHKSNISTTAMIKQQLPSLSNDSYSHFYENYHDQHLQSRPVSITLPVDKYHSDTTFSTWNQLQTDHIVDMNITTKNEHFDKLTTCDHPEPTYLNAALNAFGYGCKPDWKHFCVSPSARRVAHARQSMKEKQIEGNEYNTTLSNNNNIDNNTSHCEISFNEKSCYSDEHENGNATKQEEFIASKPEQTIGYYYNNESSINDNIPLNVKKSNEICSNYRKVDMLNKDNSKIQYEQQDDQLITNSLNMRNKDDTTISSESPLHELEVNLDDITQLPENIFNFDENPFDDKKTNHISLSLERDETNTMNNTKGNLDNIISAIKSKTPPIKRRNTALAIKAKSTKLRQPLNIFIPTNIQRLNQLEYLQSKTKVELTPLYENDQSLTNQMINSNDSKQLTNLSNSIYSSLSDSLNFTKNYEHIKTLSSSFNELSHHFDIVNNQPFKWINCIKHSEVNNSYLELSINNDVDYVMNLLKTLQTFEYQLINVINSAKNTIKQQNIDNTNDNLTELINLSNDELLTGIGHTQMLINGNLTTLRKLCKVYLEANSHLKKQQSIDYIPLRSDLEGFWDLILLQYRRYELQFPILVNWISKDFRNELHILIEKCLDNSNNYSNEYHEPIRMNNENRNNSKKPTNIVTKNKSKKSSDVNNKSIRSIQPKTKIRQEIDNARRQQLLEKRKNVMNKKTLDQVTTSTTTTNVNNTDEAKPTSRNTFFYTIE